MFNRNLKFKMKKAMNRWLVATVCLSMVLSGFAPVTQSLAVDAINSVSEMVTGDPLIDSAPLVTQPPVLGVTSYSTNFFSGTDPLGSLTGNEFDPDTSKLRLHMESGLASIDIYRAIDLAHTYSFSADRILEIKRKGNRNWTQTETEVQKVIFQPTIDRLQVKYPEAYAEIRGVVSSLKDQAQLLRAYDQNGVGRTTVRSMIDRWKEHPKNWIIQFEKDYPTIVRTQTHPAETLTRLNLTASETASIDETTLLRLETIANEQQMDAKTLIVNYLKTVNTVKTGGVQ